MIVDIDTANDEFQRFVDSHDIDVDPASMDAEDNEAFVKLKRTITGAICKGSLVIDDEDRPVLTLGDGSTPHFSGTHRATLMEMDKVKKGDVAKMHAVLKSMCQVDPKVFAAMPHRHYKIAQAILTLFMS